MKIGYSSLIAIGALIVVPASFAQVLYSNGPVLGSGGAWNITPVSISDSFSLTAPGTVDAFDFTTWNTFGDDTLTSIAWALGTSVFGSDVGSGTATLGGGTLSSTFSFTNFGYDIVGNTVAGLSAPLSAGTTYWLTLNSATTLGGNSVYWDENDGPSAAFSSGLGSLANGAGGIGGCANQAAGNICTESETFDVRSGGTPEPGTLGLLGCGVVAMAGLIRRKRARTL